MKKISLMVLIAFCSIICANAAMNYNDFQPVNKSDNNILSERIIEPKQNMLSANIKKQDKICDNRFGFWYVLDPYANVWSTMEVYNQSKIFIINVEPNSAAAKAGLKVGDEIKKINGTRVVKMKGSEFDNYLTSQDSIQLDIKNAGGGKKTVNLTKSSICVATETEPLFDTYWGQICPYDLDSVKNYLNYITRVSSKLTPQLRTNDYAVTQNELNAWVNKKNQFRRGFNSCLSNSYSKPDANACLNQLVTRTLDNIAQEQNLQNQRAAVQAQQEAVRTQQIIAKQQFLLGIGQIYATLDHAHALRHQHVNVSGNVNVEHSGRINLYHY